MRMRMTLLAVAVTLIPLAIGVVTAGAAVRAALLQDAYEIIERDTMAEDAAGYVDGQLFSEANMVPGNYLRGEHGGFLSHPSLPACGLSVASYDDDDVIRWEVRTCRPGEFPDWGNMMSPFRGSLSLWPWTDPEGERLTPTWYARPTSLPSNNVLIMIISLEHEQARLNTVMWQLFGGMAAITALAAGFTWFTVGRVLRPVEAIRAEFAELSAHHLDRRVPVPRTGNEITRLATTMNTTLNRLQIAVDRQRQFVADASHELRTPLACLRTELELASNHPDTPDWPQVVDDALGDAIRLQDLIDDLLLLARLDADTNHPETTRHVDLTDLVREETARRHPPGRLTLTTHTAPGPLTVIGHRALLARILGNLLDNAERHGTAAITICLTYDTERQEAVIDVRDDGPGIPPEHHQRIFERFTRLDDARTRDTGGSGLGLAIAQRIATTHHGSLTIAPTTPGTNFTLRLPSQDTPW